jgi:hypothetical protein
MKEYPVKMFCSSMCLREKLSMSITGAAEKSFVFPQVSVNQKSLLTHNLISPKIGEPTTIIKRNLFWQIEQKDGLCALSYHRRVDRTSFVSRYYKKLSKENLR